MATKREISNVFVDNADDLFRLKRGKRRRRPLGGGSRYWTPQIPTSLWLTVISDTEIKLDWTNIDTNGNGVSIERSTDGINYSEIATVNLGVTTYSNTGLTAATLYFYRIRAYKGTKYSDYSNIVDVFAVKGNRITEDNNKITTEAGLYLVTEVSY